VTEKTKRLIKSYICRWKMARQHASGFGKCDRKTRQARLKKMKVKGKGAETTRKSPQTIACSTQHQV
jgi:hypothetical protein